VSVTSLTVRGLRVPRRWRRVSAAMVTGEERAERPSQGVVLVTVLVHVRSRDAHGEAGFGSTLKLNIIPLS
jgi:hypothetical protein